MEMEVHLWAHSAWCSYSLKKDPNYQIYESSGLTVFDSFVCLIMTWLQCLYLSLQKFIKIVMNEAFIKCLYVLISRCYCCCHDSWYVDLPLSVKFHLKWFTLTKAAQVGVGHSFKMHATGWKWKLTTCLGGDNVSRIRNKTSVGLFPGFDLRFGWRAEYVLPELTGQVLDIFFHHF